MKHKTWIKTSFYSLLLGWFFFMILSLYSHHNNNENVSICVFIIGLSFCLLGSFIMLPLLRNEDLFKSIEELEKEREKYYKIRIRIEQKINEL
jgi:hypothetical protein